MTAVTANTPDHDTIRATCRRLQSAGLTFKAQAKEAGIPYGTFTNFLGGTYEGDNDKVAADVDRWLRSRDERAVARSIQPNVVDFVPTETAADITARLIYAQSTPDIVVIVGGPGIGKTKTARQYKATHPNVFVATMRPTTSGVHTMLQELAEVMSVGERSANRLARAIGNKVQDANALLIIDEAQHLQTAALDELRSVHDAWGVGIAIMGNETVYSRIEGEGKKASLAQLYSRVGARLTRAKPKPADFAAIIAAHGIDDAKAVELLTKIADKPGALRGMVKTINYAHVLGGPSEANIRRAWRERGNVIE